MKTIKTVSNLVQKAENNGVAIFRRSQSGYLHLGSLTEIYRVENDGETASLYHYETLTAKVNLKKKSLVCIYGESFSDADSIGTFVSDTIGFKQGCFGYRPVNGGFYLGTPEKNYFLKADGKDVIIKAFNELNKAI